MATNSLIASNVNHINNINNMIDDMDVSMPPSPKLKILTKHEMNAKQKRMRQLKQQLRNEEMKLVLLKKLRQSQQMKENIVATNLQPSMQSSPQHNHNNRDRERDTQHTQHLQPSQSTHHSLSHRDVPHVQHSQHTPHTISHITNNSSNSQQMRNSNVDSLTQNMRHQSISQNKSFSVLNSPNARNNQNIGHPLGLSTQKTNSNLHQTSSQMRSSSLNSLNRTPVTTPPNVVLGYSVPEIRAQQQNNSILNSHSQTQNQIGLSSNGSPAPSNSEMSQTPAQRQAAAKLALRKQLEKTLLQIPPPKPPPPEMHFIPNANNQEFVYYLGLETVVDFLTDSPNQNRPPPDPFECVQCGTDFTPVWKWQDRIDPNRDRPAVICETCVTSNIKKALKAEHTNRLKTAFVKALQQEQEIEQRIASGAASPPLPPISPPSQQTNYNSHQSGSVTSPLVTSSQSMLPQAPPAHSSLSRLSNPSGAAVAAVANSAALLHQMPKLSAAHQSLFAAQAQQLQQLAQSLPQPQPAHMLPFAPLLAAQAYSYSMLGKSGGVPSSELHRQYLLDMIPPRSLPQGSINWKT